MPIELDETGRWVTVQDSDGVLYTACIDELQDFKRESVPQVDRERNDARFQAELERRCGCADIVAEYEAEQAEDEL